MTNTPLRFVNQEGQSIILLLYSTTCKLPPTYAKLHYLNPEIVSSFGAIHERIFNEELIIYIGCGDQQKLTNEAIRCLAGQTAKYMQQKGYPCGYFHPTNFSITSTTNDENTTRQWAEGWLLALYHFTGYKARPNRTTPILHIEEQFSELLDANWLARIDGILKARDWVNEPANKLYPQAFVTRIKETFEPLSDRVQLAIHDSTWLEEQEMNGILTVAKGSQHKPYFVELTYCNDTSLPLIILVGKGVTFDMGGVNIKVARDLSEARFDMGGAAAVLGTCYSLAASHTKANIKVLIPIVENAIGAEAYLPSTVIHYANGSSVQVGNTDAEGRLILADALLYAHRYKADMTIDIATLTGNVGQALGLDLAGAWSNTSIQSLIEVGQSSGDYIWQLPLWSAYNKFLNSDYADFNNIPNTQYGGACIAALFIEKFVDPSSKWIHIDMANTVAKDADSSYYTKGATGYGVRLLFDYIKTLWGS